MSGWARLDAELDAWQAAGKRARLWWRDDDATHPSPALDRLLDLRRKHDIGLGLAVIPARAVPELAERLAGERGVAVFQHGWAHANHAPPGGPKAELGLHRPVSLILGELARGWLALDRTFGTKGWHRVVVPPHNRIAPEVRAELASAGYCGLSAGLGRRRGTPPDLIQVNAHCDIMDWVKRAFGGADLALDTLVDALAVRRRGEADPDEAVGFLTHHLAHDAAAWAFSDEVLARLKRHPAVAFVDPAELFV